MKFMTIHSSKGLQADIVFSVNNRSGRYGFPAAGGEPAALAALLGKNNTAIDEERRLFYVAMTRAKDTAYIMAPKNNPSVFFREIFPNLYSKREDLPQTCPICGGQMVLRDGKYGKFYGCSNYSARGCKYTRPFGNRKT